MRLHGFPSCHNIAGEPVPAGVPRLRLENWTQLPALFTRIAPVSLEGRLPTLNQLATEFGLSAKQLNIEFKVEFGQSIFEYVTNNRLEQVHEALLESSIPMKVLSERLGYSHVNHFITAFRRRFGYPPGSLRRR